MSNAGVSGAQFQGCLPDNAMDDYSPTQREFRWQRRRQNSELRHELENINRLIQERGSRTLLKYIMESLKRLFEELKTINNKLVGVLGATETLADIDWARKMEESVLEQNFRQRKNTLILERIIDRVLFILAVHRKSKPRHCSPKGIQHPLGILVLKRLFSLRKQD